LHGEPAIEQFFLVYHWLPLLLEELAWVMQFLKRSAVQDFGVCWSCSFWWRLLLETLQGLLMVWGFTVL
jgi:hypothetical protein